MGLVQVLLARLDRGGRPVGFNVDFGGFAVAQRRLNVLGAGQTVLLGNEGHLHQVLVALFVERGPLCVVGDLALAAVGDRCGLVAGAARSA